MAGMTVAQLIELLKDEDPDAPVMFQYDYGDHAHTMVAETFQFVTATRTMWNDPKRCFTETTPGEPEWDDSGEVVLLHN